jgi:Methyltransferase domain
VEAEAAETGSASPQSLLAGFSEIVFGCLDAVSPERVVEVGAFRGEFTRELLEWGADAGVEVTAIEPDPPPELVRLGEGHPELRLIRKPSLEALRGLEPADALIIDGDHNHYTVLSELRLIAENAGPGHLPLLLLHDVGWPHARRDTYYEPERIPAEHRQPLAPDALLAPGVPGIATAGLFFPWAAAREGGSENGVLTAVEDFMEESDGLRFALIPAFFGLGVIWSPNAPWADGVAELVAPLDRNPMLERLEAARLAGLVQRVRLDRQEAVLRSFLNSRAFALAERLSSIRQGGDPVFSREQVRRLLED